MFQVKLSYCPAWNALPLVDIARSTQTMGQIRKKFMKYYF